MSDAINDNPEPGSYAALALSNNSPSLDLKELKKEFEVAQAQYVRRLSFLTDALEEDVELTVSTIAAQYEAWNAYYEGAMEVLRVSIRHANAQRRANNKKK